MKADKTKAHAIAGLLTGALVWGLIWYPFRVLEGEGLFASVSTAYVYGVALVVALLFTWREVPRAQGYGVVLLLIGLIAGWTNLAYVIAIIEGEVMRVMLLFYLAPLWTVLFARWLLNEKPGGTGLMVILVSAAGAVTMLWNPAQGLPIPTNRAEWLGLSAGMAFALSNVLIRKADGVGIGLKSLAVFAGVTALAVLWSLWMSPARLAPSLGMASYGLVVVLGLVILATNWAVQYGISKTPATQAIVILLFELVVAAWGSYVLAGEAMTVQEWAGGALIVAASLLSGRLGSQFVPGPAVLEPEAKSPSSTRA
ncbi:MAG: DMT family transporter [Burkholderiales bacterium]